MALNYSVSSLFVCPDGEAATLVNREKWPVVFYVFSRYCFGDIPTYRLKYFPKNEMSGKLSE